MVQEIVFTYKAYTRLMTAYPYRALDAFHVALTVYSVYFYIVDLSGKLEDPNSLQVAW